MKVLKLSVVWLLAALLTSCMGEGGDPITMGVQPGVVRLVPQKTVYLADGTQITSSRLESMDVKDGDCCLVDYKTDRANLGIGKPVDVDILKYDSVPRWTAIAEQLDTLTIQRNERFLTFAIAQSAYVQDELFLFSEVGNHRAGQVNTFYLSYDPRQKAQQIDGKHVYEMQLRAIGEADTTARPATSRKPSPNAFNIKQFVKDVRTAEGTTGKGELHIVIKYPQSFNRDTTKYLWSTSAVFTFLIHETE